MAVSDFSNDFSTNTACRATVGFDKLVVRISSVTILNMYNYFYDFLVDIGHGSWLTNSVEYISLTAISVASLVLQLFQSTKSCAFIKNISRTYYFTDNLGRFISFTIFQSTGVRVVYRKF